MKIKRIAALCCLLATMLVIAGCSADDKAAEIIDTANIESISVELFDGTSKAYKSNEEIENFVSQINLAEKTNKKSVQDVPDKQLFTTITINDGKEILYYYKDGYDFYLEKPYVGIYRVQKEMDFLD